MKQLLAALALASLVSLSSGCATQGTALRTSARPPLAPRTIVLVHGAFADGSSWDRVAAVLQAHGYNTVAVHQPLTSLADDVAATKRAIDAEPGQALLVGHSYGGAVITEAGNDEKVVGLVYVAAFAPDSGESINMLGKGQPPPPWAKALKIDTGGFAKLPDEIVASDFAQDVSPEQARVLASKQGPIFARNFDDPVTTAAWHKKPSWYVRAAQDHMIDPNAQAFMAGRIQAKKVTSLEASHVLMVSQPEAVAEAILAAAASVGERASASR